MKRLLIFAIIGPSLCQAADPKIIERHEQVAEQVIPMEVDNAPIEEASAFKRPRSEERCIRKEQHPAKRRRIQTAEEAEEMALDATSQDNITLVSNDGKKIVISKQMAFISPTLERMATMPPETSEESATGQINFKLFNHDEIYMLVDIFSTLSDHSNETEVQQAETLNRKGIINRTNLNIAQNLADFFELPAVHASLGLLFISNSGLADATIKNKLSIKKYFERGMMDTDFTGVSIQDLIDHEQIPDLITVTNDSGTSYTKLNLRNKHINSLYGLNNIPGIKTVQFLNLNNNRLTALPNGIFDQLTQLTHLELGNNRLTALPNDIFNQLPRLTLLGLYNNQLTTLPNGIFDQLTQLTKLMLHNNRLTDLPNGIFGQLTQLTELALNSNRLTTLPNGIFDQLTRLTLLALNNNQLAALPDGIFDQLTQLTQLQLSNNQLQLLPSLNHLNNLQELWLHNNPLPENTKQIIRQQFARLGQKLRI